MRFWRICRQRYAGEAASGEGARRYGGRWNSRGVAMVYASTSLALAAIETFVNLEPNLQPSDYVSIAGEIPQGLPIGRLEPATLPSDWRRMGNEHLRRLGDAWVAKAETVALRVPSAVILGEWNVLLSPAHPQFSRIKLEAAQPFEFDPRMFR